MNERVRSTGGTIITGKKKEKAEIGIKKAELIHNNLKSFVKTASDICNKTPNFGELKITQNLCFYLLGMSRKLTANVDTAIPTAAHLHRFFALIST